ncbi:restriction endonuclease subunit S [Neorhizobium sp. AL 9.2.2]|uniref:restriction endonuclease subunit S n=1 Tax=Neorhizobium sp. AL 9.2.2 TaxID=2712894 RepID=UPI0015720C37|nr:restriction endonuclease subunit S [Neorhizobium sp. AL 9.2.2]
MTPTMVSLGEISESIVDGPFGSSLKTSDYVEAGVPVLQGKNITGNKFVWKEVRYISHQKSKELFRSNVKVGDHLLIKIGSIGYSAIIDDLQSHEYAIIPANLARIRPDRDRVNDRYLHHCLISDPVKNYFLSVASSTAQPALSLTKIKDCRIPLPPLDEQKRIAAILDKADQLRQKRRQAIALLDSLTKSIFLEMFGDPVINPMGWPTASVDDLCALVVDCVNRTAPLAERPTEFKMIRTTNVKNGKVLLSEVRYVEEEIFQRWNRRATPKIGDVLLTREAPVGEVGILETPGNFFLGQRLMLYRPDLRKITAEFLAASFRSAFLIEQIMQSSSGSTVKHLPLPACRSFVFRVPPIELQQKFSKSVLSLKNTLSAQVNMSAELGGLFASLQHRAFSGQL